MAAAGKKQPSSRIIAELSAVFHLFDKDGDDSISTDELLSFMKSLGLFPSGCELKTMLKEVDFDGDGTFSCQTFVQAMASMGEFAEESEEEEEKELRQTFRIFDKSGRGYITAFDLRVLLQNIGEALTRDEVEKMIAEVDIDGDGQIDFEEFKACMRPDVHCTQLHQVPTGNERFFSSAKLFLY